MVELMFQFTEVFMKFANFCRVHQSRACMLFYGTALKILKVLIFYTRNKFFNTFIKPLR